MNSPISTVLTVECFLEVILSIYRFKMVNFFLKTAQLSLKHVHNVATTRAKFNPGLMKKSNDDLTSHRYG